MSRASFFGKTALETFFMLPLVLPPTVVGFILIVIFGKHSLIGQAIEWIFQQPVIFTWWYCDRLGCCSLSAYVPISQNRIC